MTKLSYLVPPSLWMATFLLLVLGCASEESVETYTVKRTAPPRSPIDAEMLLRRLDHTLVAILPQQDQAWFFKLVGKAPAIERNRKAFEDFLTTVTLADTSSQLPKWNLPAGWKSGSAKEMRLATLLVPDEDGELELAISSLPLADNWEDFLVRNVTRWLRQLGRQPLEKKTVMKLAREASIQNGDATIFELSGLMQQKSMGGNPHAGLGIPPPRSTPEESIPPSAPGTNQPLVYETPEGWRPGKLSMMRKAAFLLPGGSNSDEVIVTSFRDNAQMGDLAANIEQWAGQVELELDDDQIGKLAEPILVDGIEGHLVELTSPSTIEVRRAITVVMLKRKGRVWFFKMQGDPDVLRSQSDAFREFLKTVRFSSR